jgi:hypothetical protein
MTERFFIVQNIAGWIVSSDGTRLFMSFACDDGNEIILDLPTESLNSLLMTLPVMMTKVLRTRFRDESLRVVYPAAAIDIEQSSDRKNIIVTFETPDGFNVSFGLTRAQLMIFADAGNELDRQKFKAEMQAVN